MQETNFLETWNIHRIEVQNHVKALNIPSKYIVKREASILGRTLIIFVLIYTKML